MLLWIRMVAEGDGLIAKKAPPRLYRPSVWYGQITRYGGLGEAETEHEKLAMNPVEHPEKILAGLRVIRPRTSQETLGRPPRQ
jgi:hypothetical protein